MEEATKQEVQTQTGIKVQKFPPSSASLKSRRVSVAETFCGQISFLELQYCDELEYKELLSLDTHMVGMEDKSYIYCVKFNLSLNQSFREDI